MSRPGSHPRRHSLAWLGQPPSQALKNATSSAFFTHAISAPLAPLMRARGLRPEKPYSRRESSTGTPIRSCSGEPVLLRGRRRFSGHQSRHQAGCGGGRAMNACRRRRCLALAKRRSAPPKAPLSVYARVRARPGRRSTLKTGGGCRSSRRPAKRNRYIEQ